MDVFISYKSEDRATAEVIVSRLEADGFSVWWDQGIYPSANWRAEIDQQLAAATCVLVLWSVNSCDPQVGAWVIQEAEDGERRGVLVPVMIDDVILPIGLRHVQAADLIAWNGDAQDPRWRSVVATVRQKISGDVGNPALTSAVTGTTVREIFRGRWPQLCFVIGVGTLVTASTLVAGIVFAATLVAGFAVAYALFNVLLARHRGERVTANLLRRAFAVTWVTYVASGVVWLAALGFIFGPLFLARTTNELTVRVVDEAGRPLPATHVLIIDGQKRSRLQLDALGIASHRYSVLGGSGRIRVRVENTTQNQEAEVRKNSGPPPNLLFRLWSGNPIFDVAHYTAEESAIDAILKGEMPPAIQSRFPKVVGVLKNSVWEKTSDFVSFFHQMNSERLHVDSIEGQIDGKRLPEIDTDEEPDSPFSRLKWARSISVGSGHHLTLRLLLPRTPDGKAPWGTFAVVRSFNDYYKGSKAKFDAETTGRLASAKLDRLEEDGFFSVSLLRAMGAGELHELNQSGINVGDPYAAQSEINAFIKYLIDNSAPPAMILADIVPELLSQEGCDYVDPGYVLSMTLPAPELRVTIIRNVSDQPLPITSL